MRRRLLLVLALATATTAVAPSCLSPTLPLPPPDISSIHAGAVEGTWEVYGTCEAGAMVTVFNQGTGRGVVVEDRDQTGSFAATVEGAACDLALVWQEVGAERSESTSRPLGPYGPDTPSGAGCP